MSRMKGNDCFYCVKTRENARNFARRKSATAGIRVGALLSQICDCRAQRVKHYFHTMAFCKQAESSIIKGGSALALFQLKKHAHKHLPFE